MTLPAADRLAILELVARYNRAVDSGDADARAETFTADGVWDSETGGVIRGREAIREHARTRAPFAHTWRHWTNSPVVEGGGGEARARQYLLLLGIDGPPRPRLIGAYEDTLRREPDGWRFARRRLVTHARGG